MPPKRPPVEDIDPDDPAFDDPGENDNLEGDEGRGGGGTLPAGGRRVFYPPERGLEEAFPDADGADFLGLEEGMDPRETFGGDYAYNLQVFRGLLCVSDYQKVLIRAILILVLKHYRQFVSRSDGGWERGLQNRIETSTTHRQEYAVTQPQQAKTKKGRLRSLAEDWV
jgi:hypothetical protein